MSRGVVHEIRGGFCQTCGDLEGWLREGLRPGDRIVLLDD